MKIRLAPWVCLLLALLSAGAETSRSSALNSSAITTRSLNIEFPCGMGNASSQRLRPQWRSQGGAFAFVITRTPYSVMPYGRGLPVRAGSSGDFERGAIFVQRDVRGRWMSEGDFVNMRPLSDSINEEQRYL